MNPAVPAIDGQVNSCAVHALQHTRTPRKAARASLQVVQKKRIDASQVSPVMRLRIVDLFLEGFITRRQHGMELSAWVVSRLRDREWDERLADEVLVGVLAEVRSKLAEYETDVRTLPARAAEAAKNVWGTI